MAEPTEAVKSAQPAALQQQVSDPRIYFAAERTFLAWIRTGLGLMGVGFAVSRFGLFLREIGAQSHLPSRTTGLSAVAGVGLVGLGVLVNISATVHHVQLTRELRNGKWQAGRVSRTAIALALVLAAAGVAMMLYLLLVR